MIQISSRVMTISVLALLGCVTALLFLFSYSPAPIKWETEITSSSLKDIENLTPSEDVFQEESEGAVPPYFIELLSDDCTTECERYLEKPEALGYCRSVCGFTGGEGAPAPTSLVTERVKSDLQLKSEAETKLDLSLCANILDAALRKACEVRVTEDLLE